MTSPKADTALEIADAVPPDSPGALDFVKANLLPYKYPREIKFIDELPKTGTGKIDRQAVMRM